MVELENQTIEPVSLGFQRLDRYFDSIKSREWLVLIGGIGFQLAVLIVLISVSWSTFIFGKTILVRVVPVDPRDLLRGDYVILSYEFSRLQEWEERSSLNENTDTWYVNLRLSADGKHWERSYTTFERPTSGTYLAGKLNGRGQLEFGIESYFVQEGEGRKYEAAARQGKLSAEIVVDRFGKAIVKRLIIGK